MKKLFRKAFVAMTGATLSAQADIRLPEGSWRLTGGGGHVECDGTGTNNRQLLVTYESPNASEALAVLAQSHFIATGADAFIGFGDASNAADQLDLVTYLPIAVPLIALRGLVQVSTLRLAGRGRVSLRMLNAANADLLTGFWLEFVSVLDIEPG